MRWLLLLTTALGLALGLSAQSAEERADAVREFKRFFRKFKTVEERIEAVRTLEGMESAAAADELVALLDHKEADVAKAAMEVLASYREEATFARFLAELPDMRQQDRRAHLVRILGNAGISAALPVIRDIVLTDSRATSEVRFAAARAVAALGDREHGEPVLKALLHDGDPLVRMAAAEAAGKLRIAALSGDVLALLDDSAWQVQTAAVQALASLRDAAAVVPLIALMQKGGRLEEECADALFRITGMDFGTDAEAWTKTWERLMSIPGWRIPTDEELAKAAASRRKYDAIYGKKDAAKTFGGIPTSSTRILFVIDVSGSMADLVVEREKFDAGYENYEKLTIVKTELQRTIESLDGNTIFNIVAFASDLDPWKPRPVPANVVNKASAKAWVERLKPIGGPEAQALAGAGLGGTANLAAGKTNTFKALMYPFGVDPDAKRPTTGEDGALENPIDTVFFLSDGRPSTGKYTDTNEILEEVVRLNDRYKMVFHTIAIGEFQKSFLESLAQRNGGVFVDLGR